MHIRLSGKISKYSSYIKNMVDYFGASLIPMIVSIVTNPIFAYFLSPEDYAIIGYYTSFNTLLTPFVIFYMLHYYQRMYFKVDEDGREQLRALLIKSLFYFSFILLIIAIAGLFVYSTFISPNAELPFFPYGILALMPCWFTNFYTIKCVDLKMSRQSRTYLKMNILNMLFTVGISLILVACFKMGALGKMTGALLGPVVMFVLVFREQRKYMKQSFDKKRFKEMVIFCAPLVIAAMLDFFSKGYDKVYLEHVVSVKALGYYSVGYTIAMYLSVFSSAISTTFAPDIFKSIASKEYLKCCKFIAVQVIFISVIVGVFIILSPYLVFLLTAGKYMTSIPYVKILSLYAITSCLYYSMSQVVVALGYTKLTLVNKILGSLCCLYIYSTFINNWQAIGASWAVVTSSIVFFVGICILVLIYKFKSILTYVRK